MYRVYLQQKAGNWTHYGHELPCEAMVTDTVVACASGGWAVYARGGAWITHEEDDSWHDVTVFFEEKFRLEPLLAKLGPRNG